MTDYVTPLCKTGEGSHREQWPLMVLCLLPAAGAIAILVISLSSNSPLLTLLLSLPFILLCGVFCAMGWLEMQQLLGSCRISPDGITVTRPFAQDQHLSWSDFQQVCICKYVSGRGNGAYPQLCFVCKGEQRSIYDRWKTHSAFHHRRLIAIDYDEELHEAVVPLCPLTIVDLRDTLPYKDYM